MTMIRECFFFLWSNYYYVFYLFFFFFFSSRRRHTRWTGDWSSDVCSSDLSVSKARVPHGTSARRGSLLSAMMRPSDIRSCTIAPGAARSVIGSDSVAGHQTRPRGERSEERRVGKEWGARGGRWGGKRMGGA